jgi:hypothetical protein
LNRQCSSASLFEKKPTERTEIIKDPTAFVYVKLKFFHVIQSEPQCLQAPGKLRTRFPLDVRFDVSLCLYDRRGQQSDELVSTLDAFKGGFDSVIHGGSLSVALPDIVFNLLPLSISGSGLV